MKTRIALFAAAALFMGFVAVAAAQRAESSVPDRLKVTIDTQQTAEPVSKYEFGMFIEHIGPLIYRSLWSEMLDDRKFYFPITSKETAAPAEAQGGSRRNNQLRKWRPVGPDENVVMDKDHPFVGDQSPRIELDAATPHGIRQSGLALVKGKKYTGRIYLRGTPGSQSQGLADLGRGRKRPADHHDCRRSPMNTRNSRSLSLPRPTQRGRNFEITGTGTGNFHIGTLSLMPADNVQGFRPDTIALLRQLHVGMWRLPGGNFISDWNWYDSIGDIDKRPPDFDDAWNAMQTERSRHGRIDDVVQAHRRGAIHYR